jgi:catechol 2,3-dioxygenase-like lactoylglutathione lyase family enzyme
MDNAKPVTHGVHHIGLTVSKLEDSAQFFITILGWKEVKRNSEYPAIFVSDDHNMITLWQNKTSPEVTFDKNQNIGLHHIALQVSQENDLDDLYTSLKANNIKIEFAPELLQQGPAKHMMCYEPSGIRVEFFWPGL